MILLLLIAVLWIVVLAPGVVKRFTERHGAGSIDHFHKELRLLEHAGPKAVSPAYRLHTAQPGATLIPTGTEPSIAPGSARPRLVLVRPVGQDTDADVEGADGAQYERVGLIAPPEPVVSTAQTTAGLAAYQREVARRRCTTVLQVLAVLAIGTGILGIVPSLRLAWIFSGITGMAALGLVGLIAYAREIEVQRRVHARPPSPRPGSRVAGASTSARAGYPGAWDEPVETEVVPRVAIR